MWNGTKQESTIIRETIISGGLHHLREIKDAIKSTGAIQYTLKLAQSEAANGLAALKTLPDSVFKSALEELVFFSVDRQS